MQRSLVLLCGAFVALGVFCGDVKAQWGYGYYPYGYGGYGWGGWGGTVQGDIARGLGYFNMGAGIYNRETAQARSINTDTAMRWNEYVYRSQQEGTREYYARRDANLARDRDAYDTFTKRMQDNPAGSDIESGDALNAALDQLSDPRIHTSALRMADTQIPAKMIRDIPFRNAAEGVTFSLSQLKASTRWPAVLLDPRFAERKGRIRDRGGRGPQGQHRRRSGDARDAEQGQGRCQSPPYQTGGHAAGRQGREPGGPEFRQDRHGAGPDARETRHRAGP